ncbi:uncharacterized protein MONOS_6154 [Monocercomonoides exilis]|uniref:uncharacterized protein n=1 Tax=Monocercomonoides exilis TaxID=2049356 RepID=UPI0035595A22|nr:hypothetical protein MONOS_6154 [Monocercomonoides exilis]|eukprot:MONOS_6154.1-p1 / transcript=MONOS_6154.1 / gene=MONOS_6154 / organism=Monocercomonoides_exilis_PA203 / gene_product=unspecified product / transcript_product=unspecified product / location=Mono_scaffold00190:27156-28857(+) / protein_length=400 / sequence_SO=supercontig / SO=protein_coding / is_pseudo=false
MSSSFSPSLSPSHSISFFSQTPLVNVHTPYAILGKSRLGNEGMFASSSVSATRDVFEPQSILLNYAAYVASQGIRADEIPQHPHPPPPPQAMSIPPPLYILSDANKAIHSAQVNLFFYYSFIIIIFFFFFFFLLLPHPPLTSSSSCSFSSSVSKSSSSSSPSSSPSFRSSSPSLSPSQGSASASASEFELEMHPAAAIASISAPLPPIDEALTPSLMPVAIDGSMLSLCCHRHTNGESVLELLGAVEVFGLPQLALMSPEKTSLLSDATSALNDNNSATRRNSDSYVISHSHLERRLSIAITTAEFESRLAGFPLEHTKSRSEADNTRFAYDSFHDSVIREQSVRLHDGNAVFDVLSYSSRLVFPTLFIPSYLTAGQLSDSTRLKSDFDGALPLFPSDT